MKALTTSMKIFRITSHAKKYRVKYLLFVSLFKLERQKLKLSKLQLFGLKLLKNITLSTQRRGHLNDIRLELTQTNNEFSESSLFLTILDNLAPVWRQQTNR